MELDELLKILTQFPESEQKKELISKAEGLAAKTNYFKEKYGNRTDEEAVKESRNLEKEIDSFVQKGYDSLKGFGDMLNGNIGRKESRFKKVWKEVREHASHIGAGILCGTLAGIIAATVISSNKDRMYKEVFIYQEKQLSEERQQKTKIETEKNNQIKELQNEIKYARSETGVQKEIEKAQKEIERIKMEEGKERTRIIIEKNKEIERIASEKEELAIENAGNKNKYEIEKQKTDSQREKISGLEKKVSEQEELIKRLQPVRIQMEKPAGSAEKENQSVYMYIMPETSGLENRLASGGKDAIFYYEEKGKAFHVLELLGKGKFKHGRVKLDEPAVFLGNAGTILYFYNERKKEVFTMNYGSDVPPKELPEELKSRIYEIKKEETLKQKLEELKTANPHYATMGYEHAKYDPETDTLILTKDDTFHVLKEFKLFWQKGFNSARTRGQKIVNIETKNSILFALILHSQGQPQRYFLRAYNINDAGTDLWRYPQDILSGMHDLETQIKFVFDEKQVYLLRFHERMEYNYYFDGFEMSSGKETFSTTPLFKTKISANCFLINPYISEQAAGFSNDNTIQIISKKNWQEKLLEIQIDKTDENRKIATNLAIIDNYCYFGTSDGTVYAYKIDGLEKK